MRSDITVCIPTIPPRKAMLARAITSVLEQTLPAAALSVAVDTDRRGAASTRNRALEAVQTPYVAFLDDDDAFYEEHLEVLMNCVQETGSDYVFSYYQVHGPDGLPNSTDPLGAFGRVFDPLAPHQTTITTLVRTELAQSVGFEEPIEGELIHGQRLGEDFKFTLGCIAAGAHIVNIPQKTWIWNHHGANTSGKPDRW